MTEKEQKIFDMQPASTKARMLESDSDKAKRLSADISKSAQCLKEDGSVDLNVRVFTEEEKEFYDKEFGTSKIYGRNGVRGAWVEEVRTNYLMSMAEKGKVHSKLIANIATPHVEPKAAVKEKAKEAFLRGNTIQFVKQKFKDIMNQLFKPTHAEVMSEAMKKSTEELRNEK